MLPKWCNALSRMGPVWGGIRVQLLSGIIHTSQPTVDGVLSTRG